MRASRNAERFVTVNQSGEMSLWNVPMQICKKGGATGVRGGGTISSDGMRFAYSSKSDCTIGELSAGNPIAVIETRPRGSLALSSDGKFLAIACDEEFIEIWEVVSDRSRLAFRIEPLLTLLTFVLQTRMHVLYLPTAVVACVWHTGDGALLARLKGLKGAAVNVSASDDCHVVAARSLNGHVAVWTAR
jgi:WD40 repeat protein